MPGPILTTKLFVPPVRPDLAPRQRLVDRIRTGVTAGRRITLISAPAGFGKTTLAATCASACGWPAAWLSLDEGDSDLSGFWRYVIASCSSVHPGFGAEAEALLADPHPPGIQAILAYLLNDAAAATGRFLLVLDDYQAIKCPEIHESLAYTIEHLPPNLHLILATRADPPLALSQLRARGHLTEIRARDLRFTDAEAAVLLNEAMGLRLTHADVAAVETRTEGWAAGLQLAGLSLQHCEDVAAFIRDFTGTHHYIMEYLTDQVMSGQPERVRAFLMQTSILDRLCGPLCDAVTGTADGEGVLQELLRQNLFIVPLDDQRRWFRYHHLFADLLGNVRRRAVPRDDVRQLHARASQWFEAEGMGDSAIRHALAAHDHERAAELIENAMAATLSQGRVTTLLGWAQSLPDDVTRHHPRLRMYQAWTSFLAADCAKARATLEDAWQELGQRQSGSSAALRGELQAMRATISMVENRIDDAGAQAEDALAWLSEGDATSRSRATRVLGMAQAALGQTTKAAVTLASARDLALSAHNDFLAAEAMQQQAKMILTEGKLREAERIYQAITELVTPASRFPPAGLGLIGLAAVALERNDLDAVGSLIEEGVALCRRGGVGYGLRPALYIQALLAQAQGREDEAADVMAQASQFNTNLVLVEGAVAVSSYQTRLCLLQGDVVAAEQWASGTDIAPGVWFAALSPPLDEVWQLARARVALAKGNDGSALDITARTAAGAESAGRMAHVVEARLLQALALVSLGRGPEAIEALTHAVDLAAPEGAARLFIEAGSDVVPLLRALTKRPGTVDFVRNLLDAIDGPGADHEAAGTASGAAPAALLDPLTPRELEILTLISEGLTNQQIAGRLFVTLNTVKKHTSNLYGKLGVSSRTQAVARARALNLC